MPEGSFSRVIAAHRELQRRNSALESRMPLDHYRQRFQAPPEDPSPSPPQPEPTAAPEPPQRTDGRAPWDDPDSWWSAREQESVGFDWGR
jgi:hypothetical protein